MLDEQKQSSNSIEPGFYLLAGVGTLLAVALVLVDMALSFAGGDVEVGGMGAVEWFIRFQESPLIMLRNLGILNVINPMLMLPLYLVLYRLHRRSAPNFAALTLLVYILGIAVYAANNRALAMLALSNQYMAAADLAQREMLATAGTAFLAQAEDFTPGTFTGFFLNNLAPLMLMFIMLRGKVFGRRLAVAGLIGTSCMFLFTIIVTFSPEALGWAMLLAMAGGLLMLGWNIAVARKMFILAREKDMLAASRLNSNRVAI